MENERERETVDAAPEVQEEGYVPRPKWQVWGARIGLVLFLLFVAYQILSIAGGGL